MTEDDLIARVSELEVEVDKKEHEIIEQLDKIEQLEETIMRLEQLIPEDGKKKKKRSKDSKLAIELEEKEIQIRELKNKMGFLRKEKVQLQQKLEKFTRKQNMGTVIRIEEKKEPFENLIKELQSKINKQQFIIEKLEKENKKEVIEFLKNKIIELNKKLIEANSNNNTVTSDTSNLTKLLQLKLNNAKAEIKTLEEQVKYYKIWKAPAEANSQDEIINELRSKLEKLNKQEQTEFEIKENQIKPVIEENPHLALRLEELKNHIEELKKQNIQQRIEISELKKKIN